jgi:hypothetical protein
VLWLAYCMCLKGKEEAWGSNICLSVTAGVQGYSAHTIASQLPILNKKKWDIKFISLRSLLLTLSCNSSTLQKTLGYDKLLQNIIILSYFLCTLCSSKILLFPRDGSYQSQIILTILTLIYPHMGPSLPNCLRESKEVVNKGKNCGFVRTCHPLYKGLFHVDMQLDCSIMCTEETSSNHLQSERQYTAWQSTDNFKHREHREATAAFRRIFHHDGKISPAWWGWGVHAHPLSLYLPSRT